MLKKNGNKYPADKLALPTKWAQTVRRELVGKFFQHAEIMLFLLWHGSC
jgi:hypothetical protein